MRRINNMEMNSLPNSVTVDRQGRSVYDLYSANYEKRRVYLFETIDNKIANETVVSIDTLAEKSTEDINLWINCCGGGSVSGGNAIIDAMRRAQKRGIIVRTIVTGMAASMAAVIASAGTKGFRMITPNAEMMIHQPLGGVQGQAEDIELTARHIAKTRLKLNTMLAESCGKAVSEIARDTDRYYYLDAEEAISYGLVDKIYD